MIRRKLVLQSLTIFILFFLTLTSNNLIFSQSIYSSDSLKSEKIDNVDLKNSSTKGKVLLVIISLVVGHFLAYLIHMGDRSGCLIFLIFFCIAIGYAIIQMAKSGGPYQFYVNWGVIPFILGYISGFLVVKANK